jgi:hypothetical protein
MVRYFAIVRLLLCTYFFLICSIATAAKLKTIALSGESAPGAGLEFVHTGFVGSPAINREGVVAFNGSVHAQGYQSPKASLWRATPMGDLELLAMGGQSAPGSATSKIFGGFGDPAVSDNGDIVFMAYDTTNVVSTIWRVAPESAQLSMIAESGQSATGAGPGASFDAFKSGWWSTRPGASAGSSGDTLFLATLTGSGVTGSNYVGLWHAESAGVVSLVAKLDDPVPGLGPETNYGPFSAGFENVQRIASVNGSGKVAFISSLTGSGVGLASNALFTWQKDTGISVLARKENAVPGAPGSAYYGFGSPVLNNAGKVAFYASLQAVGPGGINGGVLMSDRDGAGVTALYRLGDAAPGTGSTFSSFRPASEAGSNPIINSEGQLAFSGNLNWQFGHVDGNNDSGIWSEGLSGSLELVVREGDQAPGTDLGVTFGNFNTVMPMLNSFGQVAFVAGVTPPATGGGTNVGFWAQDSQGALQLIVIEGGQLDVDDGPGIDLRTVSTLRTLTNPWGVSPGENSGNEDGRPSSFNDLGQIVFAASFTDGSSGIFVSNAVANFDGDYNADGVVDAADYTIWRDTLRASGQRLAADGNRDGIVNAGDYEVWKTTFGQLTSTNAASSVSATAPEPSTYLMVVSWMLTVAFGRRR